VTIETIARALQGKRVGASRHMARCPAHDDHTSSLSVAERDGKVLVYCHSGCSQTAVIEALRSRGLWPEKRVLTPAERKKRARERREFERIEHWRRGWFLALDAAKVIADRCNDTRLLAWASPRLHTIQHAGQATLRALWAADPQRREYEAEGRRDLAFSAQLARLVVEAFDAPDERKDTAA
jgi:rhodanese-related sulfurtransferase